MTDCSNKQDVLGEWITSKLILYLLTYLRRSKTLSSQFVPSDGDRRRVEIGLYQCDIRPYGSQGQWNLLL